MIFLVRLEPVLVTLCPSETRRDKTVKVILVTKAESSAVEVRKVGKWTALHPKADTVQECKYGSWPVSPGNWKQEPRALV